MIFTAASSEAGRGGGRPQPLLRGVRVCWLGNLRGVSASSGLVEFNASASAIASASHGSRFPLLDVTKVAAISAVTGGGVGVRLASASSSWLGLVMTNMDTAMVAMAMPPIMQTCAQYTQVRQS